MRKERRKNGHELLRETANVVLNFWFAAHETVFSKNPCWKCHHVTALTVGCLRLIDEMALSLFSVCRSSSPSSAAWRRRVHQPRAARPSEGCEVGRDGVLQTPRWDGGKPQSGAGGGRGYEEEPGECGWQWLTGFCLYLLYFIRLGK